MQTVDYFINAEKRYKPQEMVWLPEYDEFGYPEDPLSFLERKRFQEFHGSNNSYADYKKFELNPAEILIFQVFIADLSYVFRGDIYNGDIPELVQEMRVILESVISKTPKFSGEQLYRFCKEDPVDFNIGDIYCPPHSLTTTIDDWDQDHNVYVIQPLTAGNTKAHELYRIYNHGDEFQVNFLTGTKFRIDDIQKYKNDYVKIYMTEIL